MVESEKMASLGQLTSGIAHEINNPINFVNGNAEALKIDFQDLKPLLQKIEKLEHKKEREAALMNIIQQYKALDIPFVLVEIQELIQGIQRGSQRIKNIVDSLRIFSHQSEGAFNPADIHQIIDSALTILESKLKTKQIQVNKAYGDLTDIYCQEGRISQVMLNVLDNAIYAIEENGKIDIRSWTEGPYLFVSIKDNGIGMDEETLQRIFDPFFTSKEVGKGTGLGLSISYGIIKEHKGEIIVSSTLGQGTEFQLKLPVLPGEQSP